jgi:tRNA (guanine37-N1)-methyltransferase
VSFAASVLTLFPEMFPGALGLSLAGRALEAGTWSLETIQIRDFASDKHRTVDDTPAGGCAPTCWPRPSTTPRRRAIRARAC